MNVSICSMTLTAMGLLMAAGFTLPVHAGEQEFVKKSQQRVSRFQDGVTRVVQIGTLGAADRWLGILALPVDEALKSHLRLDERLLVQDVVPESPAAQAGIRRNDILLKLGDAEIHNLQDLVQAVETSGDDVMTLTYLREGQEQTASVKPEKRPGRVPEIGHVPELRKQLEDRVAKWSMSLFGAGPHAKFPENLTVKITKSGDKPAKISVQREGESWDVTEDNLQELPDDVRSHVERLLGRGNLVITATPPHFAPGPSYVPVPQPPVPGPQPPVFAVPPGLQNRFELRHETFDKAGMEQLRKELRELRSEVEALKKGGQPAAPSAKPE